MQYKKSILGCLCMGIFLLMTTINVNAETTSIARTGFSYANGHPESAISTDSGIRAFCIEYGKHYANKVDDLKECITSDRKMLSEFTTTNFVGWGEWEFEDESDHTLDMKTLEQVSTLDIPSSKTNSSDAGSVYSGTKEMYDVKVKTLREGSGLWNTKQKIAASVASQYIDNDRCLQVVFWAIANEKISARIEGNLIYVTFANDCDEFIVNNLDVGANSGGSTDADEDEDLSGVTDDGFLSVSRDYDTIRQYRRFVWIVSNWHQIPSFASESPELAKRVENVIHLRWDDMLYDGEGGYTATVNDENGVLDWYDFTSCLGSGFDISQPGDGTLTISTRNKIVGGAIVNPLKSVRNRMFPEDGKFYSIRQLKWSLEGKSTSFKYTKLVKDTDSSGDMVHSLDYTPECTWEWECESEHHEKWTSKSKPGCYSTIAYKGTLKCTTTEHTHNGCDTDGDGINDCGYTEHSHTTWASESNPGCYNTAYKKGTLNCGETQHKHDGGPEEQTGENGASDCAWDWTCTKTHYKTQVKTATANYKDWQDLIVKDDRIRLSVGGDGGDGGDDDPYDPIYAYIAVVTDDEEYEAKTDVDVQLINEDGEEVDHIIPGEMYKLRYIYTYKGASKGFYQEDGQSKTVPYYYYNYKVRMLTKPTIKSVKNSYANGNIEISTPTLDIKKTKVTMKGVYTTLENGIGDNAYPSAVYKFSSGDEWNDKLYLDAMTTDDTTDGYTPLPAMKSNEEGTNRSVQRSSKHANNIKVKKNNDEIEITWTFDTDYQVFTSPIINATGYIEVGESKNQVFNCYEEKYNFAEDEDHLDAGDEGYFGKHEIYTKNARYETYAIKNKVWQTDVELTTSNVVINTGAGITQPIYSSPGVMSHRVNYNVYYTIELQNPKAHIYWNKITKANNEDVVEDGDEEIIDTSNEDYTFDVNTLISWNAEGTNFTSFEGTMTMVDHITTGKVYIQREIPAVLKVLESSLAKMKVNVNANYDRLVYEGAYTTPTKQEDGKRRVLNVTISDFNYTNNKQSAEDIIYPAMNPSNHPKTIVGNSNYNTTTCFNIKMGDETVRTVYDRLTKEYMCYDFEFNTWMKDNKVTFPNIRKSVAFFKYSNTNYTYNDNNVKSTADNYTSRMDKQTEKYYISQVLFKSNYTVKHNYGENEDGWVDMVLENNKAIVAAGQGFELKVIVKYENSLLTQYLARYFGYDDAQCANKGSTTLTNKTPQYCNISPLTGGYISGYTTLDKFVTHLITGSNVYADLYAFMSDNPNSVYSATGIYNTPIIFDRVVDYSDDYSETIFTYTMKKSTENGVASSFSNMKFYTSQLASDSETPGIVLNGNKEEGKHSITLWTPIVAATGFDYPEAIEDRYIGDAIEIGYTIKSTGADDSFGHIVQ